MAKSSPAVAPTMASNTLSVSNWRIRRQRLAPIANRTVISLFRPAARANRRLATFPQAMISTSAEMIKRMVAALVMRSRLEGGMAALGYSGQEDATSLIILGKLLLQLLGQVAHRALRLGHTDARFQPAHYVE